MEVWGLPVFVGGKRLKTKDRRGKPEYLIIISSEKSASTACCVSDDLWQDYRLRWKIETLFQALKGRGFELESCRLSKENRLSGWFGFLAIGFCWCLKVGRCLGATEPLPPKNHGRCAMSAFQRGLNELQKLLCCLAGKPDPLRFHASLQELCAVK